MAENYYDLTPINDADIEVYKDALEFGFSNEKIRNIAITGVYGAGKSSLIESYKEQKKDTYKFLHISLAHFGEKEDSEKSEKEEISLYKLEAKILNQLIHQISSEKIPQTNFKIKNRIDEKKITKITLGITVFFLAFFHLKYFNEWSLYVLKLYKLIPLYYFLAFSTLEISKLISGLIMIIVFVMFLYTLIKKQSCKNLFKKLSVQGNEIEISEDGNNESCFDKYLNEVLYLFEQADVDVIVFEDIDRFEINQIFERLREINSLVNNRLNNEGKTLKFLYLLKDDIFSSKERTKFFDFIIPVIPVIDSSNSYDKILEIFFGENIEESFLEEVSLFIDDMRLLRNISNEFKIYKGRLGNINLNLNNLLGTVIYKNLFPRDFSDLQLNQGFVYYLFSNKEKFIENERKKLEEKIVEYDKEIDEIKKVYIENKSELEELEKICSEYSHYNQSLRQEWRVNKLPYYKELIEKKEKGEVEKLESQKKEIEFKIRKIKEKSLAQILTSENTEEIFFYGSEKEFLEIRENKYYNLLKYLIKRGYLNENYSDYMAYFYGNSIKKEDKNFVLDVYSRNKIEWDYKLENPSLVIRKLGIQYFEELGVLNYDLFEELLKKNENEDKVTRLLKTLKEKKELKFLINYYRENREKKIFIIKLSKEWNEFFKNILVEEEFSDEERYLFSIDILENCSKELIEKVNIEDILKEYIEKNPKYLKIEELELEKVIESFKTLNIKFNEINYEDSNKDFFEKVYENSMYSLNISNINLMLKVENNIQDEELKNKNYTHICKNRNNELFRYIDENIDDYFRVIIDNYNDIEDDSEIVIEILNKVELNEELKEEYIEKLKTKITDISKIENKKYLDRILEKENVIYTSGNILTYFNERKQTLNDILINFINLNEDELEFSNYSAEELEKFFDRFIVCNELDNEVYKKIIGELGWHFESGNFPTTILKDKMDILIEKDIVVISKENLLSIRKSYKENIEFYIQKNIEKYIEILNTEPILFLKEELLLILENNNISEKNKLKVLEMSKETISIKNKNYSENIKNYILDNNYDKNDFEYLVLNYENFSDTIKDKIFKFILESKKEFNLIIEEVSEKLLDLYLESSEIEKDEKLSVLLNILDKSTEAREFKNKLNLLNLEEYKNIFRRSRTLEFEKTEFNKKLLEKLLEKDYIEKLEEREKIEEESNRKVYEILTKENPLKIGRVKEK